MPFTAADVFNAIVGYYLIVLAVSAGVGVTRTLRDGDPSAAAAASVTPGAGASSGAPTTAGLSPRLSRVTGLAHSRALRAFHRFGWATGVGAAIGWLAGRDLYRWAQPRTADLARRARARRDGSRRPEGDSEPETPAPPVTPATAPDPKPAVGEPPATPSGPDPGSTWPTTGSPGRDVTDPTSPPLADAPRPALDGGTPSAPDALPGPEDPHRPGRPWLVVVPEPQEYPDTMPAADITDLESLIHFTDQTATVAGMESEDAAAASASMIAGAEFAGETAMRVAGETTSLEAAVAAMAMLRVDPESTAAYHQLLEAGSVYRDTTATFSVQCHDAAATAGQMAAAAANYHETAQAALAVLNAHQMPHAEAAAATGHSGAHGAFYGVADTGGQGALPASGAPALPAS